MVWKIEFDLAAERDIDKLGRAEAERILRFMRDRVSRLDDPRMIGEPLKGPRLGGLWKYRAGDYRIIAEIDDAKVRVLVVRVGNRKDVYR